MFFSKCKCQKDCNFSYEAFSSIVSRYLQAAEQNRQAFAEFKNAFSDKEIVLLAAGPSVNDFTPIKNAVYIGMNRSLLYKKAKLDFLFAIDMLGISSFVDEFINYQGNNCIKFIGHQGEGVDRTIPESIFLKLQNARKYQTDSCLKSAGVIPVDIDIFPLWNSNTVAIQAMQFALFTNPKKIYLVGCDSNGIKNGHFIEGKNDNKMISLFPDKFWIANQKRLVTCWNRIKEFAQIYYPDTEIVSVNPIGLKGMFKDVYTKSFLDKHPEIDASSVEILDNGKVD